MAKMENILEFADFVMLKIDLFNLAIVVKSLYLLNNILRKI